MGWGKRWEGASRGRGKSESSSHSVVSSSLGFHGSLPGFSVHGTPQARILEWVAIPSLGDLPDTGIEPVSPALQGDPLPSEPPGKPKREETYTYLWLIHVGVQQKQHNVVKHLPSN